MKKYILLVILLLIINTIFYFAIAYNETRSLSYNIGGWVANNIFYFYSQFEFLENVLSWLLGYWSPQNKYPWLWVTENQGTGRTIPVFFSVFSGILYDVLIYNLIKDYCCKQNKKIIINNLIDQDLT